MKKATKIISIFLGVILFGCNSGSRTKSPEELRMELKQREQATPTVYLQIEGVSMKPNKVRDAGFFHDAEYDGYMVEGVIKNKATLAKFKDIVITVNLSSQTGTVIDSKDFVVYEFYEPNTTKLFHIKMNPTSAVASFHATVKSAVPVL